MIRNLIKLIIKMKKIKVRRKLIKSIKIINPKKMKIKLIKIKNFSKY